MSKTTNRIVGGLLIGLTGVLCLYGIVELLAKIAGVAVWLLKHVIELFGLSSLTPGPTLLTMFTKGVLQNDPLFVKVPYYILKILLFLGLFVAIGLFSFGKNTLMFAKYWCYIVLFATGLYVFTILIAPLFQSSEAASVLGYYFSKLGIVLEFGLQMVLVVVATRLIDEDLNHGQA